MARVEVYEKGKGDYNKIEDETLGGLRGEGNQNGASGSLRGEGDYNKIEDETLGGLRGEGDQNGDTAQSCMKNGNDIWDIVNNKMEEYRPKFYWWWRKNTLGHVYESKGDEQMSPTLGGRDYEDETLGGREKNDQNGDKESWRRSTDYTTNN